MAPAWHYFEERRRECERLGLDDSELVMAEDATDENIGIILGRIPLGEGAYLQVYEIVEHDRSAHRLRYAYFLVVDGKEVGGFERDLSHKPEEHGHCGSDHEWVEAGRISFQEATHRAREKLAEIRRSSG